MYKLLPAIVLSILLPSNFANASSDWTMMYAEKNGQKYLVN